MEVNERKTSPSQGVRPVFCSHKQLFEIFIPVFYTSFLKYNIVSYVSQEFSHDKEGGESIFPSYRSLSKLSKVDWDVVEKLIESFLDKHMRTWGTYTYFIIDDNTMLIKVYRGYKDNEPAFTIKARLVAEKLELLEVS
jgi:hypothetical protein